MKDVMNYKEVLIDLIDLRNDIHHTTLMDTDLIVINEERIDFVNQVFAFARRFKVLAMRLLDCGKKEGINSLHSESILSEMNDGLAIILIMASHLHSLPYKYQQQVMK